MKIFKIKGLPPTALYSEEPGYCSVVDTGAYSMSDKKDLDYVYWKIINNGNQPFLWIESPEKIFVIIQNLLEAGCYDYTVGKDPELRRNFSKVNSENVIICIKFPTIDAIRNRPELIPRFEWVTSCLYSILENAKKIYNEEKEAKKVCSAISHNDLYDRLGKAQKDAVEKELASIFEKDLDVVVNNFSINSSRIDPFDPLFTIETKINVYLSEDRNLNKIISDAGKAFCDGAWQALKDEAKKAIMEKAKLERALKDYLEFSEDSDTYITDITTKSKPINDYNGAMEFKITITMKNFDDEEN